MSAITVNPRITENDEVISLEIEIAAPPERVYQALSDPARLLQWWGQRGIYRTTSSEYDPRPGGKWVSRGAYDDGRDFEVHGEYLKVEPPHLIVFTWISNWTGGEPSVVHWELIERDGGTLLKLNHSGLESQPEAAKSYSAGWPKVLGWLQLFIEEGVTIDSRA